jgi:hypothetical protein
MDIYDISIKFRRYPSSGSHTSTRRQIATDGQTDGWPCILRLCEEVESMVVRNIKPTV